MALAQGEGLEYVFLSIVTQVPFWADHKIGLEDAAKALNVKTTFTGPLDFDTAAQARQLDELVARKPAGLLIFPGDAAALAPGIDRAVDAGIPVAMVIGDVPESKRSVHLGISNFDAGKIGGEMLAEAIAGKGKVLLGTFPAPAVLERVEGYKAIFKEKYPEIQVADVVNDKADPSYAPTAYAQAIQAHPDIVGIGGTDGDSGKGAALAVKEAGKQGQVKIIAMDRNPDMLPFIEEGTIAGRRGTEVLRRILPWCSPAPLAQHQLDEGRERSQGRRHQSSARKNRHRRDARDEGECCAVQNAGLRLTAW